MDFLILIDYNRQFFSLGDGDEGRSVSCSIGMAIGSITGSIIGSSCATGSTRLGLAMMMIGTGEAAGVRGVLCLGLTTGCDVNPGGVVGSSAIVFKLP